MALNHKKLAIAFLIISFLGFLDATYLTVEHYRGVPPPCSLIKGCEKVTTSKYAAVFGVPVALSGLIFYLAIFVLSVLIWQTGKVEIFKVVFYLSVLGFLASLWFLYLQLFVIGAICVYCLFSALTSTAIFGFGLFATRVEDKEYRV